MRTLALAAAVCGLLPLCVQAQTSEVVQRLQKQFDLVQVTPEADLILINKGRKTTATGWTSGKFGYADAMGEVVVPPTYDTAFAFKNGFAVVGIVNAGVYKEGLIDRTGRIVVPLEWNSLGGVNDGVAVGFKKKDGVNVYSLIDTLGRVTPIEYPLCKDFVNGLAIVRSRVPRKVAAGQSGQSSPANIEYEEKYGYITTNGKLAVPCQFVEAKPFESDGLAAVAVPGKYDPKWGFVDRSGRMVVPCRYYSVDSFSEGLALVGKITPQGTLVYGYINSEGVEVIPCQFDEATRFNFANTWVGVNKDGVMAYTLINSLGGSVILQPVYNLQDGGRYGQAVVASPNSEGRLLFGIMSIAGRMLLPFEYDQITIFSERDPNTGQWREAAMATKGGEQFSFDISRKPKTDN